CAWAAQMMETGAAVPCPDNDCGPRVITATLRLGGQTWTERQVTSGFVAYAGGAAGFWVGGFGSPDQYTPTLGGASWCSNNGGGTLISPGFGFTLRGSDALSVGVAVFATAYTGQQQSGQNSEKPPIDYEQWARVQGDLDMLRRQLLIELSMARP